MISAGSSTSPLPSLATLSLTSGASVGALGAMVSIVISAVVGVLTLFERSVAVAVMVSAPSPIATITASVTGTLQVPLESTTPVPMIVSLPSVKVMVAPTSPVPVIEKPASASSPLTILSTAIGVLIVGAAGAVVSPSLEPPPELPPESAAPAKPRPANPASQGRALKAAVVPTHQGAAYSSPPSACPCTSPSCNSVTKSDTSPVLGM